MRYINFNGNIYPGHEALLPVTNRAYRYGDGFFESMVMFNQKMPLLEYHWNRLTFTAAMISACNFTAKAMAFIYPIVMNLVLALVWRQ